MQGEKLNEELNEELDEDLEQEVPQPELKWENVLKFIEENKKIIVAKTYNNIYYIFGLNSENKVNKITTTKQIADKILETDEKGIGTYFKELDTVIFNSSNFSTQSPDEYEDKTKKDMLEVLSDDYSTNELTKQEIEQKAIDEAKEQAKTNLNNWNEKTIDSEGLVKKIKQKNIRQIGKDIFEAINNKKLKFTIQTADTPYQNLLDGIDVFCDNKGKVLHVILLENLMSRNKISVNIDLLNDNLTRDVKKANLNLDDIKRIIFEDCDQRKRLSQKTIEGLKTLHNCDFFDCRLERITDTIHNEFYNCKNNYKICDFGKKLPEYRKQVSKDIENRKKQMEELIADVYNNNYLKEKINLLSIKRQLGNDISCGNNLFYNYQTNSFSMRIDTTDSNPPIDEFTLKVNFDKKNRLKNVECIKENGEKACISADYNFEIKGKTYNIKDMYLNNNFGLATTAEEYWQNAKGLESFEQFEEIEFAEFEKNFHEYYLRSAEIAKQYGQIQKNIELIKEKKEFRNKRAKLNNKKNKLVYKV